MTNAIRRLRDRAKQFEQWLNNLAPYADPRESMDNRQNEILRDLLEAIDELEERIRHLETLQRGPLL